MKTVLWVLLDDRMGSIGQARGVLRALSDRYEVVEKKIVYNRWAQLPNWLKGASRIGMNQKESDSLSGPWPHAVLSISRRTTPLARWIKRQNHQQTKIIQLMYPGSTGIKDLDLVIVPEHDRKPGRKGHLYYVTGCPHRVSAAAMDEARAEWNPQFAALPRPFTSVIVGGAIKGAPFTDENAAALAAGIKKIHQQVGGSILITTSRRTGATAQAIIKEQLATIPAYTYWWGEQKANPIMGFWGCADRVIVTGDTVSMCCESCGSGKPVLIFCGHQWLHPKHLRFVDSLYEGGFATSIDSPSALEFQPQSRLDPSEAIAAEIDKLF